MQKENFIRDNLFLNIVKFATAVLQAFATRRIFYDLFRHKIGTSEFEAHLMSITSVVVIDAFFLALLYILESEELPLLKKISFGITGTLLVIAIFIIGYLDEGALAFALRMPFFLLMFNDIAAVIVDYRALYNSREAEEQRIRNREVIARRKAKEEADKTALKSLKEELKQLYIQRNREQLGIISIPETNSAEITQKQTEEELPEGVSPLPDGNFGWRNNLGELQTVGATGNPYTSIRGAQIARARHLRNGNGVKHAVR